MAAAEHDRTPAASRADLAIAGRYELLAELGHGRMGRVWHARDLLLGREVAIKEVLVPAAVDPEERRRTHARIHHETRLAARLTDAPSVVTIYDVLDVEDRPWVVMQLVAGRSLRQILTGGPVPLSRVTEIAVALVDALCAAHAVGVHHGDITPGNVLLSDDGPVLLTDFGVATIDAEVTVPHGTGILLGSPAYLAPERLAGHPPSSAADLWSVGVTLYAAVEGDSPFRRDTLARSIQAVLYDPIPPPSHAGPLAPLLANLLNRDPRGRPTAEQAWTMLDAPYLLTGPHPPNTPRPAPRPAATDAGPPSASSVEPNPATVMGTPPHPPIPPPGGDTAPASGAAPPPLPPPFESGDSTTVVHQPVSAGPAPAAPVPADPAAPPAAPAGAESPALAADASRGRWQTLLVVGVAILVGLALGAAVYWLTS